MRSKDEGNRPCCNSGSNRQGMRPGPTSIGAGKGGAEPSAGIARPLALSAFLLSSYLAVSKTQISGQYHARDRPWN
jgi:hypothetical protein